MGLATSAGNRRPWCVGGVEGFLRLRLHDGFRELVMDDEGLVTVGVRFRENGFSVLLW